MRVWVCRDCGEEYRLDAAVQSCSDCGGLLETRNGPDPSDDQEDGEHSEGEEDRAEEEPPPDLLRLHVGGSGQEIAPLLERLAAAEIRFWVRARVNAFEVHVKPDDYERAMEQRAALNAGGGVDAESRFDAATGYVQCPACGEPLDVSHADCPGCGLALRSAVDDEEDGPAV
jgi:rRNA maturation endonuclease Nob1